MKTKDRVKISFIKPNVLFAEVAGIVAFLYERGQRELAKEIIHRSAMAEIYLIKKIGENDKINYIKTFEDGSVGIVGANKIDGYATVTFFETATDIGTKQKYLDSIKKEGISVFSGRAAYPPSIAQIERVSASLPDVRKSITLNISKAREGVKGQAVKGVKEVVKEAPKFIPENTIQKLINAIDEAIPLNVEQKKLYSQEVARRTARVAAMGEKVAGEKGLLCKN